MNQDLTLICGQQTDLNRWVAQALIEKQRREYPGKLVAFFFLMRLSDGTITLANRNLHWVSYLDPEAAKAAACALAHSLNADHDLKLVFDKLTHHHVIMCCPERADCPIEPTTIIDIS
jgi:hypothetical protein